MNRKDDILMILTVPCLFGLESLVADEMKRLQLKNIRAENGRVHCTGTYADIARLNISLRCGARVLMELGSFRAPDFEALFQGVLALPWEDYIPRDGEFPVKGYSINSTLHSVPACQAIVKKAAASRLGRVYGCETLPETGNRYQIQFAIIKALAGGVQIERGDIFDDCELDLIAASGFGQSFAAVGIAQTLGGGLLHDGLAGGNGAELRVQGVALHGELAVLGNIIL